jgi:hypothetical protein
MLLPVTVMPVKRMFLIIAACVVSKKAPARLCVSLMIRFLMVLPRPSSVPMKIAGGTQVVLPPSISWER